MMENQVMNCHVDDALHHINQAEYGAHYMIIYPELDTLRELYSNYVGKQIEDNNEIVIINPFYETTDSVRQVLSQSNNHDTDISKYEKEQSLLIADSLEEYLGDQPLIYVKKGLANYTKMGKKGLSVLADLGAYPHKSRYKDLIDYELSLPTAYDDVALKGFCLYHQKDFDKLSDEQKEKLIEHHGKALKIMHAQ
jgi:MEDS: MEthanogen/methylotroph, DcmR Sensory domain